MTPLTGLLTLTLLLTAVPAPIRTSLHVSRPLLHTDVSFTLVGSEAETLRKAADAGFAEIERLQKDLNEWRGDSDVFAVNQAAGLRPVHVNPDTFRVVTATLEMGRVSEGALDISFKALAPLWRFGPNGTTVPPALERVMALLPLVDYHQVVADAVTQTVFLRQQGMRIGLGCCSKGYVLDRVADVLRKNGVSDFLIIGGGDTLASGKGNGHPWRVGVQHPRRNAVLAMLEVERVAVSTSGDYYQFFEYQGVRYHHLLDPRTGFPARGVQSATIIAPSATEADALDTAVFVLGVEKGLELVGRMKNVDALIVDDRGQVHLSPGMRKLATLFTDP